MILLILASNFFSGGIVDSFSSRRKFFLSSFVLVLALFCKQVVSSHNTTVNITCQPKHLHLSLGPTSDPDGFSSIVESSMTVSFTVPFECGTPGIQHEVLIKYGQVGISRNRVKYSKGESESSTRIATNNTPWQVVIPPSQIPSPRQHNATHHGHSLYISDYFYHVSLSHLSPKTEYQYEIDVRKSSLPLPNFEMSSPGFGNNNFDIESTKMRFRNLALTGSFEEGKSNKRAQKEPTVRRGDATDEHHKHMITNQNQIVRSNLRSSFSSGVHRFQTPPLPGDQDDAMTLAIVADLGQTIHSAHTIGHMARYASTNSISAILHAGDISYADCDLKRWDSWFDMVDNTTVRRNIGTAGNDLASSSSSSSSSATSTLGSSIPWHTCPGNHELEIEHFSGNLYASYRARFAMPKGRFSSDEYLKPLDPWDPLNLNIADCGPSVAMTEYYYGNSFHSIEIGLVKAILLNTYTSSKPGSIQYEWLTKELVSVDRTTTPWIVILMHGPFYNTFKEHSHESMTEHMKINFEPLFIQHDVNLVICGHVHAYSRTKPVKQDVVASDERAPTYIILGDGGNREGHATYVSPNHPEEWIEVRDNTTFGFGLFNVLNQTHAKWLWMKNIDEGHIDTHDHAHLFNYHFL